MIENPNSDFEVRLNTLEALGGDADRSKYNSIFEVDLAILKATQEGGGGGEGISAQQCRNIVESYGYVTNSSLDEKGYATESAVAGKQDVLESGENIYSIIEEDGFKLIINDDLMASIPLAGGGDPGLMTASEKAQISINQSSIGTINTSIGTINTSIGELNTKIGNINTALETIIGA